MPDYQARAVTSELIREVSKYPKPVNEKGEPKPKEIFDKRNHLILRHQPSGKLTLYVYLGRGKRKKICDARDITDRTKKLTFREAINQANIELGKSAGGHDFSEERQKRLAVPTLKQYLSDYYEAWATENMRSGKVTVARIRAHFLNPPIGNSRLNEITIPQVKAWMSKRQKKRHPKTGRRIKPETINGDVAVLKAALGKAVSEFGLISANPLAGIKMLKVDRNIKTRRAFDADEQKALASALAERDAVKREERASHNRWLSERGYELRPNLSKYADNLTPAVLISMETGLRRGELFSLQWQHVDFTKEHRVRVVGEKAKSGQTRDIPLNESARRVFRDWWLQRGQPKRGYVFPGRNGGKVGSLKKSYYQVIESAGIQRIGDDGTRLDWHSLRHTFGSRLGAAGIDSVTIKELMGHSDLKTTQQYLHSEEKRKQAAVEQLESVL